jgi:pimeloyl-ACP methyl ester carboxylesterase
MSYSQSGYVNLENRRLHYLKMGTGKRLALAFPGYANTASLFLPFEAYLGKEFTLLSFDLPHHGKSEWDEDKLHKKDLAVLMQQLIEEYKVEKVSLVGYSMGGRVCLTLTELVPEKVDNVLLIASDGLVFNPFYYFVTRTAIGKRMFNNFLVNPKQYLKLITWLKERKVLDSSRYKFFMYYLESENDRSFLLKVWPAMSHITPERRKLSAAIKRFNIPVFVFMGAYDKIIPVLHAKRFKGDIPSVHLHVLEKGHRVFDADSLPQMADCLLKGSC